MSCPVARSVADKILARSEVGVAKYGVTLARTDLDRVAWLRHLQEELMDASNYIERVLMLPVDSFNMPDGSRLIVYHSEASIPPEDRPRAVRSVEGGAWVVRSAATPTRETP